MRSSLASLILLAGLLMSTPATAARSAVAFAPFHPLGISRKDVARVRRWLRAAATSLPPHIHLRASRKLAQKLARIPACTETSCVARVAKKLGIHQVVLGHVGSIGGAFVVYLQLIDDDGKVVRRANSLLDPRKALRKSARTLLFRLLAPKHFTGTLSLQVNVKNAWIYLDGQRVGQGAKLLLPHITVGTHALRITQTAYRDFVRFVHISFKEKTHVTASLERLAIQSTRMHLAGKKTLTDAELPWYRRWWAVTAFGAIITAATTTTLILIPTAVDRDRQVTVRPW